ncbi:hypothetical protein FKG94_16380 [Exilibacterium tricleocarpae]|uniref:Nucleotide modification associated domain-containing protein n=1 Tax=Exilibacterium tricleocarpae TaxID=2591008 RepID=A0A545TAD8_9GAMM|nr:hypothetical protein [Exilibacterium tricleocarpae]TQV74183.1 hypothetical protein FKG94_16380 [Exilibacterium tricleocarpae]
MRIILSRKGFDSGAGGCPSPLFPDGTCYALPIPDPQSRITYGELHHGQTNIGELVRDLTGGTYGPEHGAHLDPDIQPHAYPRQAGWRPLLGQTHAAQGHLRKQNVDVGDLFLFFGLFRPVAHTGNGWRFIKQAPARHALWGWLQIDKVVKVDTLNPAALPWVRYHPHLQMAADKNNTLYIATERLHLNGRQLAAPGAGSFARLGDRQQLTAPDAKSPTCWRLPLGFFPALGKVPLSYHHRRDRWRKDKNYCYLTSAARGQEFVLDTAQYPEVLGWLQALLTT